MSDKRLSGFSQVNHIRTRCVVIRPGNNAISESKNSMNYFSPESLFQETHGQEFPMPKVRVRMPASRRNAGSCRHAARCCENRTSVLIPLLTHCYTVSVEMRRSVNFVISLLVFELRTHGEVLRMLVPNVRKSCGRNSHS